MKGFDQTSFIKTRYKKGRLIGSMKYTKPLQMNYAVFIESIHYIALVRRKYE